MSRREVFKVPQIRFSRYVEDWKEKTIGAVLTEVKRPIVLEDNQQYELITVRRRNEGIVSRGHLFGRNILVKNYSQLQAGDFVVSKRQVVHGATGIVPAQLNNAIVSNEYLIATSNKDISTEFLTILSRLPEMKRKFFLSSYGVDIEKLLFDVEDWKKRAIIVPDKAEQEKICSYFKELEQLIQLSQNKHEKLVTLRQAMLQGMFPQPGAITPRIRFKGFVGGWCKQFLHHLANRYDNLRVPVTASNRISGSTPYYGANGVQDYVNGYTHDGEFILVAEDGASDIKNYPVQFVNGKIWVNNHAHVLQAKKGITSNLFLKYAFSQKNMEPILVGGGRAKLNAETMMQMDFMVPAEITEQQRIGQYFYKLDSLISLNATQLEKLKQIRAACLGKMFV